jgi:hypothetical protein
MHDIGEGREVDSFSHLHSLDAERDCQMALAGAGRSEQMHDLVALDEAKLGQCQDASFVEGRLEGEVEAGCSPSTTPTIPGDEALSSSVAGPARARG